MGHFLPYFLQRSKMKTLLFLALVGFVSAYPDPAADPNVSGYIPPVSYGLGAYGGYYGAYAPYVIGRKRRFAEPVADPKANPYLGLAGHGSYLGGYYGLGSYYGAYAPYVIGRKRRSAEPAAEPEADPSADPWLYYSSAYAANYGYPYAGYGYYYGK